MLMDMDVSIASDSDRQLWDDIIFSSIEGTLFHTWKWLKIMEKHNRKKIFSREYQGKLYPLIVREGDEIIGLIPVFFYNSPLLKIACSPPFSVENYYLGPVMKKNDAIKTHHKKQDLLYKFQKALDYFLKNTLKSNYISIHSSPGMSDPRPFIWSGYNVEPAFTNIIDLLPGEKTVYENFKQSVRTTIRKLEKNGVSTDFGSRNDVGLIYDLLERRDRIYATKEFIYEIYDNFFPENLNFFIAKKDDILLTGIITIAYKDKVSVWMGAPKITVNGVSPNYIVYWESIRWACQHNFEKLEIIGATDLALFPFKSKFNGEIIPYYSMKWYSPLNRFFVSVYRGFFPRQSF
jgi:lipid II:glycine glycyltransferase (peptidoglycan interpeptide bridge formation enzyme)